ncbi:unnamed protein product [Callosobruchus maculatus]|uniref:Uncharacterized protein n=1 Tax=Callosobruchus maculatus TaxID=64391 RepID=A0A653DRH0_CALMS|nr:unnamed protein product [Callosobruchus maculatus]
MACGEGALLSRLKTLLHDIEGGGCPPPQPQGVVIQPQSEPCATCCMVCPPPILAPTSPQPVKPLRLPCPTDDMQPQMSEEEAERTRYANFYNNYNVDWHADSYNNRCPPAPDTRDKCKGAYNVDKGCPTGFKPCTMKLTPPANCHPCGVWCAEIQPCPPKSKKKSNKYEPGPCKRPCCKHWKPKDGECQYDLPCKAHCYNHPPGIKPRAERQQAC